LVRGLIAKMHDLEWNVYRVIEKDGWDLKPL